ncbi:Ig-like domain-containing protein [Peptococcus simiae]|uniref:Ig-like domain-containing protein n=1 Tax=Peptococcus simiae TaxID=1643805 RepID=UPI0039811B78
MKNKILSFLLALLLLFNGIVPAFAQDNAGGNPPTKEVTTQESDKYIDIDITNLVKKQVNKQGIQARSSLRSFGMLSAPRALSNPRDVQITVNLETIGLHGYDFDSRILEEIFSSMKLTPIVTYRGKAPVELQTIDSPFSYTKRQVQVTIPADKLTSSYQNITARLTLSATASDILSSNAEIRAFESTTPIDPRKSQAKLDIKIYQIASPKVNIEYQDVYGEKIADPSRLPAPPKNTNLKFIFADGVDFEAELPKENGEKNYKLAIDDEFGGLEDLNTPDMDNAALLVNGEKAGTFTLGTAAEKNEVDVDFKTAYDLLNGGSIVLTVKDKVYPKDPGKQTPDGYVDIIFKSGQGYFTDASKQNELKAFIVKKGTTWEDFKKSSRLDDFPAVKHANGNKLVNWTGANGQEANIKDKTTDQIAVGETFTANFVKYDDTNTNISITGQGQNKAPRDGDKVVVGKIENKPGQNLDFAALNGKTVNIYKNVDGNPVKIGSGLVRTAEGNASADFTAAIHKDALKAGEEIWAEVETGKDTKIGSEANKVTVQLNPDDLNTILPTADKVLENFKDKAGVDKAKYDALVEAVTAGKALIDADTKKPVASVTVDKNGQTSLDTAYAAIKKAIEALTANSLPSIEGPAYKEIFKGETINLDDKVVVDVDATTEQTADKGYIILKDSDNVKGKLDLQATNGKYYTLSVEKEGEAGWTPVADTSSINATPGNYKVTYTIKDSSNATATHTMTLVVKDSQDFVPQGPGEKKPDVPDNFVKVEFKAGDHGTISPTETKIYWVDPAKSVTLTAPYVQAAEGYKHTGWDKALDGQFALAGSEKQVDITAQYKKKVVEGTDQPKKPGTQENDDDYVNVTFAPGEGGNFEAQGQKAQTTSFWVLKDEPVSFNPPTPTKTDYDFAAWDPVVQESYSANQQHTATYTEKETGFKVEKATSIKFVEEPNLTYLVEGKDANVQFVGKDGHKKAIYLELSYEFAGKPVSKIFTLEELMKDTDNIEVTPAKDTATNFNGEYEADGQVKQEAKLAGKNLVVSLKKVSPATATSVASSGTQFAIKIDADNNGKADVDEVTDTPIATASNIGDNTTTTVKGTAPKNATVTIKYTEKGKQEPTVKTVTAGADGSFTYEIDPKLDPKTEVTITAKDGEKQESAPYKTLVFNDKNGNGKDDESEGFDITKADKIEMVYDPAKMDYLVTEENGTVALETKGMLVRVTDKLGKEKTFTAEEIKADTTNFKVEPVDGSNLTTANDGKKVKVTLVKAPDTMQTKFVETSKALSVKLDKNNNGIADEKEAFDIDKTTEVVIIQNPSKMDYLVETKEGTTPFDTAGLVIKLKDASGKTVTYNAEELKGLTDKITLSPANEEALSLDNGKTKTMSFTVTVPGAKDQPSATGGNVTVKLDADKNGKADVDEKTTLPQNVKAMNQNKVDPQTQQVTDEEKDTTTVTGKVTPGAKVTIQNEAGDDITPAEGVTVNQDGTFTAEVTKQPVGKNVKVIAQVGEKQPSDPATATVFRDKDNNGEDDNQAGVTERPAAIASNKGKTPTFTTVTGKTEKDASITVKVKVGEEYKDVTVEKFAIDGEGNYSLEAKYEGKPLAHGADIQVFAQKAPKKISAPQTTTVFTDKNNDGKPDDGKVDLADVKDIQVIAPNKMAYTNGDALDATGLKAVIRDNKGGIEIFDYDTSTGKFKNAAGDVVDGITANVNGDTAALKDLVLATNTHDGKAIEVKVGNQTGATTQKLQVKELQTPTPTIVFAANQNTVGSDGQSPTATAKNQTTVKFTVKNKPTKVYIKYTVNGEAKEETVDIQANDDATKTVDLAVKLPVGTEVQVLAKDADKTISEPATAKVVRDANNDGSADEKTVLKAPAIDDIKAGSETIKITKPADGVDKMVITETDKNGQPIGNQDPIEITKDKVSGKWKIGDTGLQEDNDGKLIIPVKDKENPDNDKLKLDEYNTVKVEVTGDKDTTEPGVATKVVGEAADTTPPAKPVVDTPIDGDKTVKVKVPAEADAKTITVTVTTPAEPGGQPTTVTKVVEKDPQDGKWKVDGQEITEKDGKLDIPVDKTIKTGDTVKVETKDNTGNKSDPYENTAVAREKLPEPTIDAIKTGDKTVKGIAKDAATVDVYQKEGDGWKLLKKDVGVSPDGSYTYNADTAFNDGDQIRVVAKKPGMEENFAVTTAGVDTTALDKAIQDGKDSLDPENGGRNDGTPADKALEEAIKEGEQVKTQDPAASQEEVDKAKEKIEKAIEEKKAYDDNIDKLKEAVDEANKLIKDEAHESKPDDIKERIVTDKTAGEKVLEDITKNPSTDPDKDAGTALKETVDKLVETLKEYKKPQLDINVVQPRSGAKVLDVTSTTPGAEVVVYSYGEEIGRGNIQPASVGNINLNRELVRGERLMVTISYEGYLSRTATIGVR